MSVRVSMVSLGCSKNQIDGEMLLGKAQNAGYELVGDVGNSDVVIVNTCGFIQSAKEEAIDNILELGLLKEEGTIKAIIVTGCLAQRYKEEILEEIPEVDAVVGIGKNGNIVEAIESVLQDKKISMFSEREDLELEGDRVLTTLPFYSYIKISEGCNHSCSYCAIPAIRGRFRSRPMENIIREANLLADNDVKELILVAQDTTCYGEDIYGEYSLDKLLLELVKIEKLQWIRILYCYPDKITDNLLDVIANNDKIVNYLDIPLQHSNTEVLKAMVRPHSQEKMEALIERIRNKIPDVTIRTTMIVGFPGETDEQFEELCEFTNKVKFDRLGCFTFSPEEGTKAATMDNQVDDDVKLKREQILMSQQADIMFRLNDEKVGKTMTVLVEGFDKHAECYFGRSEADAPDIDGKIFFVSETSHNGGDFVKVEITDVMDYDLMGEIV